MSSSFVERTVVCLPELPLIVDNLLWQVASGDHDDNEVLVFQKLSLPLL